MVFDLFRNISIHALLAESDFHAKARKSQGSNFYPRSPCGERRGTLSDTSDVTAISIHALLAESDIIIVMKSVKKSIFLSTLSLRRATWQRGSRITYVEISIHALLAESDGRANNVAYTDSDFYPRSPCGERHTEPFQGYPYAKFLSTLSLRRATVEEAITFYPPKNFYPRSPCGERRFCPTCQWRRSVFLSTLSLRRATKPEERVESRSDISIHALLAESDPRGRFCLSFYAHFYPRSPCGERPPSYKQRIHRKEHFYPRSPCGERQPALYQLYDTYAFLSTLSLRRATHDRGVNLFRFKHFYPRSPCGERRAVLELQCVLGNFYPRSPCGERQRHRQ